MGMNKSKGNMYEWITHTWNPLAGECPHKCSYCSTNRFYYPTLIEKYKGEPRLVEKEMHTNLGVGNTIFVCAQNDLFAEGVPEDVVCKILEHCEYYNQNTYLFQTKNPEKILTYNLPEESIICTTIETNREYKYITNNSPSSNRRACAMSVLSDVYKTYLTIEPILDFDLEEMVRLVKLCSTEQVNIGADSGGNGLPEPTKENVLELIGSIGKFTNVKLKKNINRIIE